MSEDMTKVVSAISTMAVIFFIARIFYKNLANRSSHLQKPDWMKDDLSDYLKKR